MTRNRSAWRRPAVARALVLLVLVLVLASFTLSGCFPIDQQFAITVTNQTDEELTVRLNGKIKKPVAAGATTDVLGLGSPSGCLIGGVTATTGAPVAPDWSPAPGSLEATMPTPICDGDTWVIEHSDLVPIDDAERTPTPSP